MKSKHAAECVAAYACAAQAERKTLELGSAMWPVFSQVPLQGTNAGPLSKISAPGGRHGNDDAGARTADPSASRWNALRTTRQTVTLGGRHGHDDAAVETTTPDGEFLWQNYGTITEQFVSLRPFAKPDSRNNSKQLPDNYGTIRLAQGFSTFQP